MKRTTKPTYCPRFSLTSRDLQTLPFSILELILDFLPPFKHTLTKEEYLIESSCGEYQVNFSNVIKRLYGYFKRDFLRRFFLVWVNVDAINLDVPHVMYTKYMLPYKRMKYFRFFNDNPNFGIDSSGFNKNWFVWAGNTVLHTIDLSYWTVDDSLSGTLAAEAPYEADANRDATIVTTLNCAHSILTELAFGRMMLRMKYLKFLDLSHIKPLDLNNNSFVTDCICTLTHLRTISVTADHLGMRVAHHFHSLTNMYKLYLSISSCDDGCLSLLCQSARLRDFTFVLNRQRAFVLNPRELSSEFIPKNFLGSKVERLELSETLLSVDHCAALLPLFPNMSKLFLHNCGLSNAHICALLYSRIDSLPLEPSSIITLPESTTLVTNSPSSQKSNIRELGMSGNFFNISALRMVCEHFALLQKISVSENEYISGEELDDLTYDERFSRIRVIY